MRLCLMASCGVLDGRTCWELAPGGMLLGRFTLAADDGRVDPRVSREHGRLSPGEGGWRLEELGGRNRIRLNGEVVSGPVALRPGDVIRLGSTLLLFSESPAGPVPEEAEPELIGEGPAMRAVHQALAAVAPRGNSVLITGETGTGKELAARALHRGSGRPGKLVALNCGGLAEGIIESELFGHVRGAFTGAVTSRDGLFRVAEQGTLFLDEIGEMPPGLQVKLLRVLETRTVRPIGAAHEVPIDVRLVAATHRDLVAAVREGRFRADLYARLAQWSLVLPPLRERREDLPLLIHHLLGRLGEAGRVLDVALLEALLLHPWPLNVRGLYNFLSMAVVGAEPGAPLELSPRLEQALASERALGEGPVPSSPVPGREAEAPSTLRVPGAAELEAVLERFQGKVTQAARHLGCSRQQLYRWLEGYGLSAERFRPFSGEAVGGKSPAKEPSSGQEDGEGS
ncbi:sigma 54-interacting transcriptional regulator [Archangium violaceum]|uniref:sigma 54-interacting transcriptional regulator n=1 Tax=Archangium violaceum TaxID=83451 RepID=UPI0036DC8A2D